MIPLKVRLSDIRTRFPFRSLTVFRKVNRCVTGHLSLDRVDAIRRSRLRSYTLYAPRSASRIGWRDGGFRGAVSEIGDGGESRSASALHGQVLKHHIGNSSHNIIDIPNLRTA